MNLLCSVSLILLVNRIRGDALSQESRDQMVEDRVWDNCKANGGDECFDPSGDDEWVDYTTADIELIDVSESGDGGGCCYTYTSTHVDTRFDCNDDNPSLSHWTLAYACDPEDGSTMTVASSGNQGGPKLGDDKSTCYHGIKFDTGCEAYQSPCTYTVCLDISTHSPGDRCCADDGWYLIKAGNSFAAAETQVPQCTCPTDNPTADPTQDPTKDPTRDPTEDPTEDPTRDPTTDPTRNPTSSPTPFCRPIVEIWVNQGCTPETIELADTEVVYTKLREYESLSEIGPDFEASDFTDTAPSDILSQTILNHGCEEDYSSSAHAILNKKLINNDKNIVDDSNWRWLQQVMSLLFNGYPTHSNLVFAVCGALLYSVCLTVLLMVLYSHGGLRPKSHVKAKVVDDDSETEDESSDEENML